MNNIKEILFVCVFTSACTIAIIAGITYSVIYAKTNPDVWFSYSSNDCVRVVNYREGDNYTCDNLPGRFYHVWVD